MLTPFHVPIKRTVIPLGECVTQPPTPVLHAQWILNAALDEFVAQAFVPTIVPVEITVVATVEALEVAQAEMNAMATRVFSGNAPPALPMQCARI